MSSTQDSQSTSSSSGGDGDAQAYSTLVQALLPEAPTYRRYVQPENRSGLSRLFHPDASDLDTTSSESTAGVMEGFSFPRQPMKLVEVVVAGGDKYTFHADILIHHSEYFRAALSNLWTEAKSMKITLEEPLWTHVFPLFFEWIAMAGTIKTGPGKVQKEHWEFATTDGEEEKPTWKEAADLWLLADYLLVPKLQNFTIDIMCKKLRGADPKLPPIQLARHVLEHTASHHQLRPFIIAIVTNPRYVDFDDMLSSPDDLIPYDLAIELLAQQIRFRTNLFNSQMNSKAIRATPDRVVCQRNRFGSGPDGRDCPCNVCAANALSRQVGYALTNEISAHDYYVNIPDPPVRKDVGYASAQGSVAQGSVAQGSVAQGSVAQGSAAQGSAAHGSVAQGCTSHQPSASVSTTRASAGSSDPLQSTSHTDEIFEHDAGADAYDDDAAGNGGSWADTDTSGTW